jgi:hypothetical protein
VDEHGRKASERKSLVLRLQDLPGFHIKRTQSFSIQSWARTDHEDVARLKARGFVDGYDADFVRNRGSYSTPGVLGAYSLALAFNSSTGAQKEWQAIADKNAYTSVCDKLLVATIGDVNEFCSGASSAQGHPLRVYILLWRRGSAVANLIIFGNKGRVTPAQALALARVQDARMR